jgi:hypothetical protein
VERDETCFTPSFPAIFLLGVAKWNTDRRERKAETEETMRGLRFVGVSTYLPHFGQKKNSMQKLWGKSISAFRRWWYKLESTLIVVINLFNKICLGFTLHCASVSSKYRSGFSRGHGEPNVSAVRAGTMACGSCSALLKRDSMSPRPVAQLDEGMSALLDSGPASQAAGWVGWKSLSSELQWYWVSPAWIRLLDRIRLVFF